jgi:hypothetical protein
MIVLNLYEPTGDKSNDSKEMSSEKLEQVLYFFLGTIQNLLGDFLIQN